MATGDDGSRGSGGDAAAAPVELLPLPEPGTFRIAIEADHPYFRDHRVRGRGILPGAACLEFAVQGTMRRPSGPRVQAILDAAWLRPILADDSHDELVLELREPGDGGMVEYTITDRWARCGSGLLAFGKQDSKPAVSLAVRDEICENSRSLLARGEVYEEFAKMGIDYGRHFRRVTYVQRHGKRSLAWLSNNDGTPLGLTNLLDCSFQAGMAISIGEHRESLMPYSLGRMVFHRPLHLPLAAAFVVTEKLSPFRTRCTVFDEDYDALISVFDLGVKAAHSTSKR